MSSGNPFTTTRPRELFIGAAAGLCAIGAFVGFRALTDEEPPLPGEWLTEADQEELADAFTQFDGWVAGCLWEKRARTHIDDVVDEPAGAKRWAAETASGRDMSFLNAEDHPVIEDMDEVSGPGYFCYVPE